MGTGAGVDMVGEGKGGVIQAGPPYVTRGTSPNTPRDAPATGADREKLRGIKPYPCRPCPDPNSLRIVRFTR